VLLSPTVLLTNVANVNDPLKLSLKVPFAPKSYILISKETILRQIISKKISKL
jgi:hypothetical protein